MKRCAAILIVAVAAWLHAQVQPRVLSLQVAALGTARSQVLDLLPTDMVRVQPVKGTDGTPLIDTYVYTEQRELVAKDDDENITDAYRWQPPRPGRYYIVVRNASEITGTVEIWIGQPRGESYHNYVEQRIFFATNRQRTGLTPRDFFGPEPQTPNGLDYGLAYVSIPRNHAMGELEGPSIFRLEFREDSAKHVILQKVTPVDRSEFLRRVADQVRTSKNREALVFVHGFNTTFEDAARRTAQIAYDLAFDGAAILFSWPSRGALTDYHGDIRNGDLSVDVLKGFLWELARDSGSTNLHIVAHSTGNRVLTAALQQLAAERQSRRPNIQQVALMAPDIDAELFRRMARAISSTAERVTLYASSDDRALALSRSLFSGYPRAGEAGAGIVVTDGIDTIDATSVGTDILGHGYFADNTSILADLYYLLRNQPPDARFGLRPQTHHNGRYWVYRPAGR